MAGTLTVTQAACHIPEIWSPETLDAVRANIIYAGLADTHWKSKLTVGDILNIPYISNPTASSKSANANIDLEVIGPSSAEESETITVSTHQYVAFGVENIVDVQSQTNLRSKYTSAGGYALASAIDTNLFTLPQSFSNSVGTLGLELTYDNILRGWQYLEDANAPPSSRYIIVTPAAYAGFLKLTEFTNRDYVGDGGRGVREAYVGQILGAPTFRTTLVRAPNSNQGECVFSQKMGVALIVQDTKTTSDWVIERDATVVLMTQIYGYNEILVPPITAGGGAALDNHNVLMNAIG